MKVVFPKNIQKWILAWMNFQIWPINLSIIQLFIVGVGVATAMAAFNSLSKTWGKAMWWLVAVVLFLVFIFIAFFKMSELSLIPFIAKLVRNLFFDITKKTQTNYSKIDPLQIAIKKARWSNQKQTIFEQKEDIYNKDKSDKIDHWGLLQ
jgi:hypothetical protein